MAAPQSRPPQPRQSSASSRRSASGLRRRQTEAPMAKCATLKALSSYLPPLGHLRLHSFPSINSSSFLHWSPPQEIRKHGDGTLGKHARNEPNDTNTGDTSGSRATLLTTTTPARQVRLRVSYCFAWRAHAILGRLATFYALAKRWLKSFLCPGRPHRGK